MAGLDKLLEKLSASDRPLLLRLLIYGVYLAAPAAALLAAYNNFFNARVGWTSTEVTLPHDAYARVAPEAAAWAPKAAYEEAFLAEFSRHYFGRPSRWAAFGEGAASTSLNIVLQNLAVSSPVLINSVGVVATLEDARPFPWRRLDVEAKLAVRAGRGDQVVLESVGLGPVTKLEVTGAAADGLKLAPFQRDLVIETARFRPRIDAAEGDWVALRADGDRLDAPLFRAAEAGAAIPAGAEALYCAPDPYADAAAEDCVFAARRWPDGPAEIIGAPCDCAEAPVYEVVESVRRLGELTRIATLDEVSLSYRHTDLKGVESAGEAVIALEKPPRFYLSAPWLDDQPPFHPGETAGIVGRLPNVVRDALTSLNVSDAARLAGLALGDKQANRGVALISTVHEIGVGGLAECDFAQSVKQPRELLAGSGYISVHLDLKDTRNGRYLVRVLVNGEEVRALRVDVLRPDDDRFDEGDVDRFAERPPDPPSPCAPPPPPAGE